MIYGPDAVGVRHPKLCAKFQADISIRSKVIRGSQNFEIWSRDRGHAHLAVFLWSRRSRGPSSMSVPKGNLISRTISIQDSLLTDIKGKN